MPTEASVEAKASVVAARATSSLPRMVALAVLANLPFILALTLIHLLPSFLITVVVGATLFLAPGLAWTEQRDRDGFVIVFRAVIASLLAALASWLLVMLLPGPTSRVG